MDKRARRQLAGLVIVTIVVLILFFVVLLNGFDWILDLNYGR